MAGEHAAEYLPDWQYCAVHWLALVDEPLLSEVRPAGEGWALNADVGDGGHVVKVPVWSDGSIVQHRVCWRRSAPGMRAWTVAAHLHEDHRPWWRGSEVPARILTAQGKTMG
jgi:hypothetical protein